MEGQTTSTLTAAYDAGRAQGRRDRRRGLVRSAAELAVRRYGWAAHWTAAQREAYQTGYAIAQKRAR